MNLAQIKNRVVAFAAFGFFVIVGTYNAVVINSESSISGNDIKFVKRLDEMYGVTVPGRVVAASISWQKVKSAGTKREIPVVQTVSRSYSAPSAPEVQPEEISQAAVQEELNLNLIEVINQKKYQAGLKSDQFSGSLITNNGVIESLTVSLPNGEGVSVMFSEMSGNVFEYDHDGEKYAGMMYQVDQNAYKVTFSNGPLEGTHLRFAAEISQEEKDQREASLAENNIEAGNFGQDQAHEQDEHAKAYDQNQNVDQPVENQQQEISPDSVVDADQKIQQEGMQAQGFNFEQQQAM